MSTFPISFTINTNTIITDYNNHNNHLPAGGTAYGLSNRMIINSSYYTSNPAPSGSPAAIDIGSNDCIEISFADSVSGSTNTIIFQEFEDVQGTLIPDTTNPDHDASLTMAVNLPQTGTATETFDITFQIESPATGGGTDTYYCLLDPKLKANQGQG